MVDINTSAELSLDERLDNSEKRISELEAKIATLESDLAISADRPVLDGSANAAWIDAVLTKYFYAEKPLPEPEPVEQPIVNQL